ncbi:DUF4097 domain-containing protein [Terriglobus sp. RCC_193]|uniref:DUF4097 family beta strand repeat-containing protein n=1 Tax=Terriglobus sp. RCC_193 TaxID=3239218 RepID=UPI0035261D7E
MRIVSFAVLTVALITSVATHAQSGKTWDKAYPVSGRVDLSVTTGEGSIHTTACGTCRSVTIHVDAHDQDLKDYKLEESSSGNQISFSLKRRDEFGWHSNHGRSPEVIVQTPADSDVTLKSGSGSTELAGVNGNINITAGSGGVHVMESAGRLRGTVGSGGFTADGGFSQFHIHSGSGGVSVRLRPGQQIDGDSTLEAGSGSVRLAVPRDLHANVDATAGSGSFHSELPMMTSGDMGRGHGVHGTMNGGGPQLRIRTGSGSTRIDAL